MKKGFTILELLVVISVLVILIGIAIPRFKGMQDAARIAQAKAELQTMQSAVESYFTNQSPMIYPSTTSTLGASYLVGATPQIISSTPPYDPFAATNVEYNFRLAGDSKYYVIYSVGAAGGGSASIVNGGTVTISSNALCVTNGTGC